MRQITAGCQKLHDGGWQDAFKRTMVATGTSIIQKFLAETLLGAVVRAQHSGFKRASRKRGFLNHTSIFNIDWDFKVP